MQALEKIGVLEKDEEKGGRRITQSGQRDLGKCHFASFLDGSQSMKCLWGWDCSRGLSFLDAEYLWSFQFCNFLEFAMLTLDADRIAQTAVEAEEEEDDE